MFKDKALIVVDETYIEYAEKGQSMLHFLQSAPNLVILRTLSKSYAAAGVRCGVAMAQSEIIDLILKVLPPYPISQTVVDVVSRILLPNNLQRQITKRRELINRKKHFIAGLKTVSGIETIYPSETNYVLVKFEDSQRVIEKC